MKLTSFGFTLECKLQVSVSHLVCTHKREQSRTKVRGSKTDLRPKNLESQCCSRIGFVNKKNCMRHGPPPKQIVETVLHEEGNRRAERKER